MSLEDGFCITVGEDAGLPCVRIIGEIDLTTAPKLIETLGKLSENGATAVRMDLSSVSFLDSAGIGALVSGMRAGLTLMITNASKPVDRALELAGIPEFLERFA